jgi:DNA-binding HxlR family transcriptional regulator
MDVPTDLTDRLTLPVTSAEHQACPVTDVLRRVGDKWSVLIVVLLADGPLRTGVLQRSIEDISQRMLTRTLRSLQRDGLVFRVVHPTVPIAVEYGLTDLGRSLLGPLSALTDWAVAHGDDIAEARAHHDAADDAADPAHTA